MRLTYSSSSRRINLIVGRSNGNLTLPSSFDGKTIVLWLAVNFNKIRQN